MIFKENSISKFHSNQNLSFYIQKNSKKIYSQKTKGKNFHKKFSYSKNGNKSYYKKYNIYDYDKENNKNNINCDNNYNKYSKDDYDEYYNIKNYDYNEFKYKNKKRAKKKISIDDNSTLYHSNSTLNDAEINETNILNQNEKIEIFENKEILRKNLQKENSNNKNLNFDNYNINNNNNNNKNLQNKSKLILLNNYNNKYFENTEILKINIKLSKDKIVEFKLRRFDDLFFTVKLFCEINKIDEKFIRPFIIKILDTLNNIFKVMNYKCNKIDVNQIENIKNYL